MRTIFTKGCRPCPKCQTEETVYLTEGFKTAWDCKVCKSRYYLDEKPKACQCGENDLIKRSIKFGPICACPKCNNVFAPEIGDFQIPDDAMLKLLF